MLKEAAEDALAVGFGGGSPRRRAQRAASQEEFGLPTAIGEEQKISYYKHLLQRNLVRYKEIIDEN